MTFLLRLILFCVCCLWTVLQIETLNETNSSVETLGKTSEYFKICHNGTECEMKKPSLDLLQIKASNLTNSSVKAAAPIEVCHNGTDCEMKKPSLDLLQIKASNHTNSNVTATAPIEVCHNKTLPEVKKPSNQSTDLFKVDQVQLTVYNASIYFDGFNEMETTVPNYYAIQLFSDKSNQTAPDIRNTSEPVWNHTFPAIDGPFYNEDQIVVQIKAVDKKFFGFSFRGSYLKFVNEEFYRNFKKLNNTNGSDNVLEVQVREEIYFGPPQGFVNVKYKFVFSRK